MDQRELVARLGAFGLDPHHAAAYFHLSLLGEAKAAEVAHATGRSRPDAYRALEGLVQAGFAIKSLERPVRFTPVPIEKALRNLLDRRSQELRLLDDERPELERLWPSPMAVADRAAHHFSVHQGLSQVLGVLGRMLDDASEEMTIATSSRLLQRLRPFTERLAKEAEGDLSVRILCPVVRAEDAAGLQELSRHCTIRHVDLPGNLHMFFADGRQMASFVSAGRAASTQHIEETVLWLDAPDVVLAQEAVYDTLWAQGVPLAERLEEVEGGAMAQRLQVLRGRWVRIHRMREMFARAESSIEAVADVHEVRRWEDVGLQQILDDKRAAGVEVTLCVPSAEPPEESPSVASFDDAAASAPARVVVDGREALEVYGSREEPGSVTHAGEWSIWSTHPESVARATRAIQSMRRLERPAST